VDGLSFLILLGHTCLCVCDAGADLFVAPLVCSYAGGPTGYALRSVRAVTAGQRLVISNRASEARGAGNGGTFQSEVTVERITVLGLTSQPKAVAVLNGAWFLACLVCLLAGTARHAPRLTKNNVRMPREKAALRIVVEFPAPFASVETRSLLTHTNSLGWVLGA
jgi:hypothetical protein